MKLPFLHILTLIFVVCKCAEFGAIAHWSWWLVLLPSIISIGLGIAVLLGIFVAFLIAVWVGN